MLRGRKGVRPYHRWLPVSILLIAFALRVHRAAVQELRGDEAFGYFFSRQSLTAMVQATLRLGEPHPVGSYLVQHLWMRLAGDGELALRFPSLWSGTLAVALVYATARAMGLNRRVASVAMALAALSPYLVWHSQDARMYSLSLALGLAGTWVLWQWLRRPRAWTLGVYGGLMWALLHVHYQGAFLWLAHNAFVGLYGWRHGWSVARWRGWGLTQIAVFLLYLPWLWVAVPRLRAYGGTGESPPLWEMAWRSFGVLFIGSSTPARERMFMALVGVGWAVWGARWLYRHGGPARWAMAWLGWATLAPLLATWLAALQRPLFNERYLVLSTPPFLTLVAAGWVAWRDQRERWQRGLGWIGVLGVILLTPLSLYRLYYDPQYDKILGWRALAATFRAWTAGVPPAQARLVITYPDPTIWYYYRGTVPHVVLPPAAHDEAGARKAVTEWAAQGITRVVLAEHQDPAWDEEGIAATVLAEHFTPVYETQVGVWPVRLYVRPDPQAWRPVRARFEKGLWLEALQVQPSGPVAGSVWVVWSRWRWDTSVPWPPSVYAFFHLVQASAAPTPLAQCDPPLEPPADRADWTTVCAIPLPADLRAGAYRLLGGVYERREAGFPRWRTADGRDAVVLWQGKVPAR